MVYTYSADAHEVIYAYPSDCAKCHVVKLVVSCNTVSRYRYSYNLSVVKSPVNVFILDKCGLSHLRLTSGELKPLILFDVFTALILLSKVSTVGI